MDAEQPSNKAVEKLHWRTRATTAFVLTLWLPLSLFLVGALDYYLHRAVLRRYYFGASGVERPLEAIGVSVVFGIVLYALPTFFMLWIILAFVRTTSGFQRARKILSVLVLLVPVVLYLIGLLSLSEMKQ